MVRAEAVCDFTKLRRREVGVARLLEAEGPEGRQGGGAGEPGPGADDGLGVRAVHQVVVDGSVERAEGVAAEVGVGEVEAGLPGVIQKDAKGAAVVDVDEEGDGLVDGVGGFLEAERVGVPHGEGLAAAVERTRLVAQTEEVVGGRADLADLESIAIPGDGRGVVLEDVTDEVSDFELQMLVDGDAERLGGEALGLLRDGDRGGAGGGEDGPGGVFRQVGSPGHADAKDVVAESGDLEGNTFDIGGDPAGSWLKRLSGAGGCNETESKERDLAICR